MADEKKPKIDLKARLGKAGTNPTANMPPTAAGGIPAPLPASPASSSNAFGGAAPSSNPASRSGGVPVPPGIPVGPPPQFGRTPASLDPSNPLVAAATSYRPPAAQVRPPQPQRIEMDELTVQEARKGGRNAGIMIGAVVAVILAVVGFFAGDAMSTSKARTLSVGHAQALAGDVTKARQQMKEMADKVDSARTALVKDRKFPDSLAKDLSVPIDFDGTKLTGVRFSAFSNEATTGLLEFITSVNALNERRTATINTLNRLQRPITEALSVTPKQSIGFVVLLGGPKDVAGNPYAVLAPLQKPIDVPDPTKLALPDTVTVTNPIGGGNVTAPKYTRGDLEKPAAIYVVPKSVSAACGPPELTTQLSGLGSSLSHLINDVRGEQGSADPTMVSETRPGLLERADKLGDSLKKIQ